MIDGHPHDLIARDDARSPSGAATWRFRELDTSLGRWTRQDPAEYVDGGSLYHALSSSPIIHSDADGLKPRRDLPPDAQDRYDKLAEAHKILAERNNDIEDMIDGLEHEREMNRRVRGGGLIATVGRIGLDRYLQDQIHRLKNRVSINDEHMRVWFWETMMIMWENGMGPHPGPRPPGSQA